MLVLSFVLMIGLISSGNAYSKYGRTCKDIGCTSNQVCVMEEDPCTVYSRNECGKYPTCKKISDAVATCNTFVCPPTKICRIDRGEPKCYDDPSATANRENKQPVQSYNPGSPNGDLPSAPVFPAGQPQPQSPQPQQPHGQPNYPQPPGYPQSPSYPQNPYGQNPYGQNPNSGIYPNLPAGGVHGQTTSKPNVYQAGQHINVGGYQGGGIGSGYPGQSGGYPRQGGGYPTQGGGYPTQGGGYPGQGSGYPGQGGGYPGQGGGYPGQGGGYPGYNTNQRGGYPTQGGGYPSQGNNNQGNRKGYGNSKDSSPSILDKITNTLKTLGLFWFLLKFLVARVNNVYA